MIMLPPSIYLQTVGRALRGRLVHAARARKLRRRGEIVRPADYSATGRAQYRWMPGARLAPPDHSRFTNPENYHLGE